MSEPRGALFLFAHQDDEYAAAPWIVEELERGPIACLFLTDGASRTPARVRDAESIAVLQSLGVPSDAIVFLHAVERQRIPDSALAARGHEALEHVRHWLRDAKFDPARIYAPAYEGGHPDHDAAHLVAAAVAGERGLVNEAWQFSLYHGCGALPPFFWSLKQLPSQQPARAPALSLGRRMAFAMLCWRYQSQRRTWLGLFPGAFVSRVFGLERVVRFDPQRLERRPHAGKLLYERLFGVPYERFENDVRPLRERLRDSTE